MFAVVTIMALSMWAAPSALAHSFSGGANAPTARTPAASPAPVSLASSPPSSDAGAGCAAGSRSGEPSAGPAASPHPSATGPSPLYNAAVAPYAVLTGHYDYEAKGAALRDQGYGKINITWTGTLVAAFLIWSIINDTVPPSNGTLNGVDVAGTWTAYATPSPCWSPTYIYTFAAEVTDDVVNGVNNLTGFPSGITNGYDPWNQSQVGPMDEGASLVVVNESSSVQLQQVTVYTGALTDEGGNITAQLNYTKTNSSSAKTTYIIADGQLPGNEAWWNGTELDGNAFPGSDPKESPYAWSYGNLSDTVTFNVPVLVGSNNTTAAAASTEGDCFTWIGQVLSVGVPATKGPYPVVFAEQGLPNGLTWGITTNLTVETGTVADDMSSITFSLGNGSYTYTVSSMPAGYTAPSSGAYAVDGGPVYIRVLFHQVLYPIIFNETGLPSGDTWEVTLTNVSQDIDQTLAVYAPGGVQFLFGNGTYNFTAAEYGLYLAEPPNGTVTVKGEAVPTIIDFVPPPLFEVTFLEQGLPTGTTWGATTYTNWGDFDNSTSERSFSLFLPNATVDSDYLYPSAVPGYTANSTTVYFGVFAAAETIDVNYSQAFPITFTETGLPSGTYWYVYITPTEFYSPSPEIVAMEPNGTYSFSVADSGTFVPSPASGSVTVSGKGVSVAIVFSSATTPTYTVEFTETGLAALTNWSVTLNYYTATTNGTYLNFTEANGSLAYEVGSVQGYLATPSSGTVNVTGGPEKVAIVFSSTTVPYAVTFTETGLPNGATWYINVTGEPSLSATVSGSTGTSLEIDLTPGSYTYTAATSDRSWTTAGTGRVTVTDAPVQVSVPFTAVEYLVTFTETGLPNGARWYVNVTGETGLTITVAGSSGTVLSIMLPSGSYTYGAATNWKNWTTTSPGTFSVTTSSKDVAVPFTAAPPASSSSGPAGILSSLWLILAILVAIVVLVLVFAWYRRRKKEQPPPPPGAAPAGAGAPPPPPPPPP